MNFAETEYVHLTSVEPDAGAGLKKQKLSLIYLETPLSHLTVKMPSFRAHSVRFARAEPQAIVGMAHW